MHRTTPHQTRAFTLLEMVVAIPLFLLVTAFLFGFTRSTLELSRDQSIDGELEQSTIRTLERFCTDARRSGTELISEGTGGITLPGETRQILSAFTIFEVTDIDEGGLQVFAPRPIIYAVTPAIGETHGNGKDDNGDGLIDELVLLRSANAQPPSVLAGRIQGWDPVTGTSIIGFNVRQVPGTRRLDVTLTRQRAARGGDLTSYSHTTAVTLRN